MGGRGSESIIGYHGDSDRLRAFAGDTDFEILTPDGELTFWEYVDFLREVMYEEYVQILRPTLIAMKKK